MFPADFGYARPRSLNEAFDLLASAAEEGDEAKVIAGGQSLLPMMKLRLATPTVLIDIADLPELKVPGGVAWSGSPGSGSLSLTVGALSTYRELGRSPVLAGGTVRGSDESAAPRRVPGIPAVRDALAVLADPQVRARGTIGGAVAHGDPASDLPAVLLALDARLKVSSHSGEREAALDDFLQGVYTTDLAEDEIVTSIQVASPGTASAYEKFPHPASHLPLAGVAAVLTAGGGAAIAVTGISGRPYRARAAEAALAGAPRTPESFAAAAALVAQDVSLLGDHHASGEYRAHLAQVLTKRALAKAAARAAAAPKEN